MGVPPPGTSSWSGRVEGAVSGLSQDGAFSTEYHGRRGEARKEGFLVFFLFVFFIEL